MKRTTLFSVGALFGLLCSTLDAQVPQLVNYQGRVVVGTTNFDGAGQFKFVLVNPDGTTTFWSNDNTSTAGSEPTAAVALTVTKGLYSVLLGDAALPNMSLVPATVFANPDVRLRVWFNDGINGSQLLTPDQRIAAVGYAMMAAGVNLPVTTSVSAGVITQNGINLMHTFGSNNFFAGLEAGNFTVTGFNNTASGHDALQAITTGANNTASGVRVLSANTTGASNTASGVDALLFNTSGGNNTAIGVQALRANTTGSTNTAIGVQALLSNTTGIQNTASGLQALLSNTTGGQNTAGGNGALRANTDGSGNTASGHETLKFNTTGDNNTASGFGALFSNTTGGNNIAVGFTAGLNLTIGSNNIAIGNAGVAGESNMIRIGTAGTHTDTFLTGVIHGNGSGLTGVSGFTGSLAGDVTGPQGATVVSTVGGVTATNVASGANLANAATNANTASTIVRRDASGNFSGGLTGNVTGNASGSAASFTGALAGNVTGTQGATVVSIVGGVTAANVAAGANLANAATSASTPSTIVRRDSSGSFSAATITANGRLILPLTTGATVGVINQSGNRLLHTFGTANFFAGLAAGNFTMTGTDNTGSGANALFSNTEGDSNTASGRFALAFNTIGDRNTASGANALSANTEGNSNTASGSSALGANLTGASNTASGDSALRNNTEGLQNTAIGASALFNATGTGNIAVGHGAGVSLGIGDNNIYIGNSGASESTTIRIGSAQTRTFIAAIRGVTTGVNNAVPVLIDGAGQLGTVNSSRRFKEDIADMGDTSARLQALRPVAFRYKKPYANGEKPMQYGLIAEEVAEAFPELAVFNDEGQPETVKYQDLTPLLLNEFLKERQRSTDAEATLREENASMKKRLAELEASLARLEKRK